MTTEKWHSHTVRGRSKSRTQDIGDHPQRTSSYTKNANLRLSAYHAFRLVALMGGTLHMYPMRTVLDTISLLPSFTLPKQCAT